MERLRSAQDMDEVLRQMREPILARDREQATMCLGHWALLYGAYPVAVLSGIARALALVPTATTFLVGILESDPHWLARHDGGATVELLIVALRLVWNDQRKARGLRRYCDVEAISKLVDADDRAVRYLARVIVSQLLDVELELDDREIVCPIDDTEIALHQFWVYEQERIARYGFIERDTTEVPIPTNVAIIGGIPLPVLGASGAANIVPTASADVALRAVAQATVDRPIDAVLVQGPPGCGKTFLVEQFASQLGKGEDLVRLHLGDQTDAKLLLGTYITTATPGEFVWQAGVVTRAIQQGKWLLIEDIDRAPADVLAMLESLLEFGCVKLTNRDEIVPAHAQFRLFATQTTGRARLLTGRRRWATIDVAALSDEEIASIVAARYPALAPHVPKMIEIYNIARDAARGPSARPVTIAGLLRYARRLNGKRALDEAFLFDVLAEANDTFASTLPDRAARVTLLTDFGRVLALPPERVQIYIETHLPSLLQQKNAVSIGRVRLPRTTTGKSSGVFAYTRHALRHLEQLMAAIRQDESLLLVGETGCGKTTIVQHLASLLGHKLTVVNMSQQTEAGDLIGGFKPLDARLLAVGVLDRFEGLFGRTLSAAKNAKFLAQIRQAFNRQAWQRFVTLLRQAVQIATAKLGGRTDEVPQKRRRTEDLLSGWRALSDEIESIGQTTGLAFSFVEGALVSAVRNGHWILLDEVNLASAETLEAIGGLLAERPSLVIPETGSLEPVVPHADFRLFACMNPATDVGKKDLPPGIRTRFTELYVASPDRDRQDLLTLVERYISHLTVRDGRACGDVVELYVRAGNLLAENRLVDGAGQKPHYSIRTLSRTLTFAATISPMYGLRRALYEAFCMSYLTLLDRASEELLHAQIYELTVRRMPNAQSVLAQLPLQPSDGHVAFKHYWLTRGTLDPFVDQAYVMTPSVERNLLNLVRAVSTGSLPVLLQGPTSAGKTSMIEYLAKRTGHPFVRINNHEHTDLQEYIGSYMSDDTGKLVFREGQLVKAVREGAWLVLDELNLAPPDVLEALNRLLDDNRELLIPDTQEVVTPHPNFQLFATQNPPGLYGGRKHLSRAFRNRFLELHFDDIPEDELETILCHRCKIPPSYAKRIVDVYRQLTLRRQASRVFESRHSFATLRDLFRWALRPAVGYEQLATNGYLLLAEKVRRSEERAAVKEVLEKVMKVTLSLDKIYDVASMPEAQALQGGIVWTRSMRRLFKLICLAFRNNEPILLVGETGCGKTTVCQAVAQALKRDMTIVNAHQNTETGDLIGAQRPVRDRAVQTEKLHRELTDWYSATSTDTPPDLDALIGLFEASSIKDEHLQHSIAQLRSLFVWSNGPLVESMNRGDVFLLDEISLAEDSVLERLNSVLESGRSILLAEQGASAIEIRAHESFQFCATMNPGGDFGKKELSPALRNRFTEIWVPQLDADEDVRQIVLAKLHPDRRTLADSLIGFASWIANEQAGPLGDGVVSVRDLLAWCTFCNLDNLSPQQALVEGAALVYLDAIGTGHSAAGREVIARQRESALTKLSALAGYPCQLSVPQSLVHNGDAVELGPFSLSRGQLAGDVVDFNFTAPTTLQNATRVVRAMQLRKPVLLEGSPGVGKTSLVTAISQAAGHPLVRINFSEQTDLMDLFGSDAPVDGGSTIAFAWRDAPFLRAMQSGAWVLLDELNLAPQSVLEGLNACLDHRAEAFVPELNRTFACHPDFRVFAAQNPQAQGGGRKGLPRSFLNRFTVVYCEELGFDDELRICRATAGDQAEQIVGFLRRLRERMSTDRTFGSVGAPWEFNLRDALRWTNLSQQTGTSSAYLAEMFAAQRLRSPVDKAIVRAIATETFGEVDRHGYVRLTDTSLQIGRAVLDRPSSTIASHAQLGHVDIAESVLFAVGQSWPVLLVGAAGSGKSTLLRSLATLARKPLVEIPMNSDMDSSDLLGSYEQSDRARQLNRAVGELRARVVSLIGAKPLSIDELAISVVLAKQQIATTDLPLLENYIVAIGDADAEASLTRIKSLMGSIEKLGSFEWVEGALIRAVSTGAWLVLDNANLCPASVLDRLNSLLEPNGRLIINERVKDDGEPLVITPHPDFRLFLTVDPSSGELSRAMRNRCLELFVAGELSAAAGAATASPEVSVALAVSQLKQLELSVEEHSLARLQLPTSQAAGAAEMHDPLCSVVSRRDQLVSIRDKVERAFGHRDAEELIRALPRVFTARAQQTILRYFINAMAWAVAPETALDRLEIVRFYAVYLVSDRRPEAFTAVANIHRRIAGELDGTRRPGYLQDALWQKLRTQWPVTRAGHAHRARLLKQLDGLRHTDGAVSDETIRIVLQTLHVAAAFTFSNQLDIPPEVDIKDHNETAVQHDNLAAKLLALHLLHELSELQTGQATSLASFATLSLMSGAAPSRLELVVAARQAPTQVQSFWPVLDEALRHVLEATSAWPSCGLLSEWFDRLGATTYWTLENYASKKMQREQMHSQVARSLHVVFADECAAIKVALRQLLEKLMVAVPDSAPWKDSLQAAHAMLSASSSIESVGAVAIQIASALIEAYVPDAPTDPAVELQVKHQFATWRCDKLDRAIAVSERVHHLVHGKIDNLLRDMYIEERHVAGQQVTDQPAEVLRPEQSQLLQIQTELDFCRSLVATGGQLSRATTSQLAADSRSVQETIARAIERLGRYDMYEDLLGPVRLSLRLIQLGLWSITAESAFDHSESASLLLSPLKRLHATEQDISALVQAQRSEAELLALAPIVLHDAKPKAVDDYAAKLFERYFVARELEAKRKNEESSLYRGQETELDEEAAIRELFPDYEHDIAPRAQSAVLAEQRFAALALLGSHYLGHESDTGLQKALENGIDAYRKLRLHDIDNADVLHALFLPEVVKSSTYDFYRDANIEHAVQLRSLCIALRRRIEELAREWPENAILSDILEMLAHILQSHVDTPLAKLLVGVEQMFSRLAQWQEIAARHVSVDDHVDGFRALIVSWRRLELSCWPHLFDLEERFAKASDATAWYNLYEMLVFAPLRHSGDAEDYAREALKLVFAFMQNATLVQYATRSRYLSAIALHIQNIAVAPVYASAILHAARYFERFVTAVADVLANERKVFTKEVFSTIKLASWKDTNVYALRDSAKRSHRTLYKIVRKYRDLLKRSVGPTLAADMPDFGPSRTVTRCEALLVVPGPASLGARYQDPARTIERMRRAAVRLDLQDHVGDYLKDATALAKELRAQTPSDSSEKSLKLAKHLKTRKRKLLADSLRELRRLGVRTAVQQPVVDVQKDQAELLLHLAQADAGRLYQLVQLLPQVREVVLTHSEDLTVGEVRRSIGIFDSMLHRVRLDVDALAQARTFLDVLEPAVDTMANVAKLVRDDAIADRPIEEVARVAKQNDVLRQYVEFVPVPHRAAIQAANYNDVSLDQIPEWRDMHAKVVDLSTLFAKSLKSPVASQEAQIATSEALGLRETFDRFVDSYRSQHPHLAELITSPKYDDVPASALPSSDATSESIVTCCDCALVALQQLANHPQPLEDEPDWFSRRHALAVARLQSLTYKRISIAAAATSKSLASMTPEDRLILSAMAPVLQAYLSIVQDEVAAFENILDGTLHSTYIVAKTLISLAKEGFCSPQDASEGGAGEGERSMDGTGLGDGAGKQDITDTLEDDEDLGDMQGAEAEEPEKGDRADDDKEKAKDIDDDFAGELEDVDQESQDGSDDDDEGGEEQDIDDELGEVDDLDPAALDQKMWDEEESDLREKETQQQDQQMQNDQTDMVDKDGDSKEPDKTEDVEQDKTEQDGDDELDGESVDNDELPPQQEEAQDPAQVPVTENLELPEDLNMDEDDKIDEDEHAGEQDAEDPMDIDEKDDIEGAQEDAEDEAEGDDATENAQEADEINDQDNDDEHIEENDVERQVDDDPTGQGDDDEAAEDAADAVQGAEADQDDAPVNEQEPASEQQETSGAGAMQNRPADDQPAVEQSDADRNRDESLRSLGEALKEYRRLLHIEDGAADEEERTQPQAQDAGDASQFQHVGEEQENDAEAMGPSKQDEEQRLPTEQMPDTELPDAEDEQVIDTKEADGGNAEAGAQANVPDAMTDGVPEVEAIELDREDAPDDIDTDDFDVDASDADASDGEALAWRHHMDRTRDMSYALCEQLRLILEPTLATKLRGDYRTGKRLNMRRIIPYIASQFKKDKIWMRRTKPSKRQYQVMLAIDDSQSMADCGATDMAFETICLVANALATLEAGEMSVVSFGERARVVHRFGEAFSMVNAGDVLSKFSFAQPRTDVKQLAQTSRELFKEARARADGGSELWQLQIVISDGVCEDHDTIRRTLRAMFEERVFVIFVVLDTVHGSKTASILQMRQVTYKTDTDGNRQLHIRPYLDGFPFDNFILLQDLAQLPDMLCTTLRQFFAAVNER